MAGQENLSKFSLDNNYSKHTSFEYYLNTLERRLNLCIEKGIPTWNIAIDLNMNRFGKKLSIDIYDKLNLIKNKFDNTLLSSFNIEPVFKSIVGERNNQNDSAALEANKQIIDYLAQNGINVIRFDNWNNFEKISEHIKNVKNVGEVLHTRIKERTSEKEDEEVIIQEEEKVKVEEIESEKEKYDDLTILIKKLEAGKI